MDAVLRTIDKCIGRTAQCASLFSLLCGSMLLFGATGARAADNTITGTVTLTINGLSDFSVSGDPKPLLIQGAGYVAGTPLTASDATTSYTIRSNLPNQRITAALSANMPAGLTLTLSAGAPAGVAPLGPVPLSMTPGNIVSGINGAATTQPLTYTLNASVTAGVVPQSTVLVTLTLLAG